MDNRTMTTAGLAVVITLALLFLLRLAERGLARDLGEGNLAKRLLRVGQVLGVFLVAAASVKNSEAAADPIDGAEWALSFGALGVMLLVVTGRLGVRLLLSSRLGPEIARGNAAAGLAAGAQYVASGIVTSVAMAGSDLHALGLSVAFFVLAMVTLHVFVALFRALTTYDDAEQIAGENFPAAISYAGVSIAMAIVVARAVEGDFVDWSTSLKGYGGVLISALAFYPVRQIFVQGFLLHSPLRLRGGRLDTGIALERNAGLAALEAVTYMATALSIARLA